MRGTILLLAMTLVPSLSYSQTEQPVSSLTQDQVRYFVSFFQRIGSADVRQDILAHNQRSVEVGLHLDTAERELLDSAAQEFRTEMAGIRQKERVLTQKSSVGDTNLSSPGQLIQSRDELARKLALTFLSSVRPATQSLIFADAQQTIAMRKHGDIRSATQAATTYSSYSDWAGCAQTAGNYCVLNPGTYIVPTDPSTGMTMELVPAGGVTLSGGGASPYSTVLQRPAGTTGPLILVPSGTSITISNLTVDGNRYSFPNQNTCTLGQCGPPSGYGCTNPAYPDAVEFWINGSANIDSVEFWGSAGTTPLYLGSGTVQWSGFYYGRSTGLWIRGLAASTLSNNTFQYNGTAGLRLSGNGPTEVDTSTFFQNRWEMSDGSGGGQLYVDYSAANVLAWGNTINGNNWQSPPYDGSTTINNCYPQSYSSQAVYGVEVEPNSTSNSIQGNEITGNTGAGVTANNIGSLYISGYAPNGSAMYIHDNNGNNPPFGMLTRGVEVNGVSSGLTLDRVLSRNNDGEAVFVQPGTTGTGWLGSHCLSSRYDAVYTTSYSFPTANQLPANTTACP
jgi:hypothetical protein